MSGLLEAVARFFSFEGGIDPNRAHGAGHGAPKARWGVGTLEAFAGCLHASSTPGALRGHSKSGARRRARCAQNTLGRISRTTICHICWNKIVSKKLFEQNFIFQKLRQEGGPKDEWSFYNFGGSSGRAILMRRHSHCDFWTTFNFHLTLSEAPVPMIDPASTDIQHAMVSNEY